MTATKSLDLRNHTKNIYERMITNAMFRYAFGETQRIQRLNPDTFRF